VNLTITRVDNLSEGVILLKKGKGGGIDKKGELVVRNTLLRTLGGAADQNSRGCEEGGETAQEEKVRRHDQFPSFRNKGKSLGH